MKSDIRKISIGKGYPNEAMHYQVGKTVRLQGIPYEVSQITPSTQPLYKDSVAFDIFISNEDGMVYWKTVADMPIIIENNVNFE